MEPKVIDNMLQRNVYDLGHYAYVEGRVGGVQCLMNLNVLPGDSIPMKFKALIKFATLNRPMALDAHVDICVFYRKWRHTYTNWVTFLKEGVDTAETLQTDSLATPGKLQCTGEYLAGTVRRDQIEPYIAIYNRYYRDPTDDDTLGSGSGNLADNYLTTLASTDAQHEIGLGACHLKRMINSGVKAEVDTSDYQFDVVAGSPDEVNLITMAQQKARLFTEITRERFAQFYYDVMMQTWGAKVSPEADDDRPTMIYRHSGWLSGYDIDGTSSGNFGEVAGKGFGYVDFNIPSKFYPEHGSLMVMCLVRFPVLHEFQRNWLSSKTAPTYKEIAGDPKIIMNEPPIEPDPDEFIQNGGSTSNCGKIPFGDWWRSKDNYVMAGSTDELPVYSTAWSTKADCTYIKVNDYDSVFSTNVANHWQAHCSFEMDAKRLIPDPRTSIFAGTR